MAANATAIRPDAPLCRALRTAFLIERWRWRAPEEGKMTEKRNRRRLRGSRRLARPGCHGQISVRSPSGIAGVPRLFITAALLIQQRAKAAYVRVASSSVSGNSRTMAARSVLE